MTHGPRKSVFRVFGGVFAFIHFTPPYTVIKSRSPFRRSQNPAVSRTHILVFVKIRFRNRGRESRNDWSRGTRRQRTKVTENKSENEREEFVGDEKVEDEPGQIGRIGTRFTGKSSSRRVSDLKGTPKEPSLRSIFLTLTT